MHIALVHVHVKADKIDAFKEITRYNAENSYQEPGIARFDVIQQQDDPTRFILVEVYHSEDAVAAHKETEHYKRWRQTVEEQDMLAADRYAVKYTNIYPGEEGW
jgi:quinol monooxygenase YgiN